MIFYHGTAALNLARIKREGLIPRAAPGGDAIARVCAGQNARFDKLKFFSACGELFNKDITT